MFTAGVPTGVLSSVQPLFPLPVPTYPVGHAHSYEPSVLVQVASSAHGESSHSFSSEQRLVHIWNIIHVSGLFFATYQSNQTRQCRHQCTLCYTCTGMRRKYSHKRLQTNTAKFPTSTRQCLFAVLARIICHKRKQSYRCIQCRLSIWMDPIRCHRIRSGMCTRKIPDSSCTRPLSNTVILFDIRWYLKGSVRFPN